MIMTMITKKTDGRRRTDEDREVRFAEVRVAADPSA